MIVTLDLSGAGLDRMGLCELLASDAEACPSTNLAIGLLLLARRIFKRTRTTTN